MQSCNENFPGFDVVKYIILESEAKKAKGVRDETWATFKNAQLKLQETVAKLKEMIKVGRSSGYIK
jgi:hypothetical protein